MVGNKRLLTYLLTYLEVSGFPLPFPSVRGVLADFPDTQKQKSVGFPLLFH